MLAITQKLGKRPRSRSSRNQVNQTTPSPRATDPSPSLNASASFSRKSSPNESSSKSGNTPLSQPTNSAHALTPPPCTRASPSHTTLPSSMRKEGAARPSSLTSKGSLTTSTTTG